MYKDKKSNELDEFNGFKNYKISHNKKNNNTKNSYFHLHVYNCIIHRILHIIIYLPTKYYVL